MAAVSWERDRRGGSFLDLFAEILFRSEVEYESLTEKRSE